MTSGVRRSRCGDDAREMAPTWAYGRCDYVRYGAAILAASIYALAWSSVLLPAPTALIFWAALTFVGVTFAIAGGAAVRTHADYFFGHTLIWSAAIAAVALCGISGDWSLPRVFGPWLMRASHGAFYVLLAYGVSGVALQIRNLISSRRQNPQPQVTTSATVEVGINWQREVWSGQVAELQQQVATLTAERDRALAAPRQQPRNDREVAKLNARVAELEKRYAAAVENRDRYQENGRRALHHAQKMEALLLAPGVETALTKAIHSDVGRMQASTEEIRARDAAFIQLRETYDQLKQRRR